MKYAVGVDLGGTGIKIALFTAEGEIVKSSEIKTRVEDGGKHILPDIANEIRSLLAEAGLSSEQILGVGVGVPGPVVDGRTVLSCVNLGWGETDVASYIEGELGLNCKIGNDANVAALGEAWKGASRDTHSSVMITIGTGIGGGVSIGGEIVTGFLGGGGEIGHAPIHPEVEGRVCGCGKVNCLELFASAPNVAANYLAVTGKEMSCEEIFNAAKAGEEAASKVVDDMQQLLGKACAFIGCVVNPEVFVIGGGVSQAGTFLTGKIQEYYDHYIFPSIKGARIILAELGNDAGVYGAAKLALDEWS